MKKLFNKTLAVAISIAMIATLGVGIYFSKSAKAEDAASYLTQAGWEFTQGGVYASDQETSWGNVGYINSVEMDNGDVYDDWERGIRGEQTEYADPDTGATIDIENNGWDRTWDTNPWRINPWTIQAASYFESMAEEHSYKVTFTASASKKKYCYVDFSTVVDGHEMSPYDNVEGALTGDEQCIVLGLTPKTFTYEFPNYVGGEELKVNLMLGAFGPAEDGKAYDYAGNYLPQVTEEEKMWNGTVTISDIQVEDLNPEPTTQAPSQVTTQAPQPSTQGPQPSTQGPQPSTQGPQPSSQVPTVTQGPTAAPQETTTNTVAPAAKTLGKVTGVKVKSVKKKTIKVTWKKVANAKTYQVKVGNKTYKTKATSKKIKNKKFKKGKKVKVKVRATATGYTTGAWSKTVKKKLTK